LLVFTYLFLKVYNMDTTTNKRPLSLEQVLNSYNLMITLSFIFLILMVLLMVTNQKGFNKSFGYQIFITAPILILITFLIKEILVFKSNPNDSFFYKFDFNLSNKPWFIYVISLITILLAIFGVFMMLYIGGIFSDSPPENNTAMILNFVVIISFVIIAWIIFKKYQNNDDNILKTLPKATQNAFQLRTRYTAIFIIFVILLTILYFVNPWNIMSDYAGPVMFFSIFVGIILVLMITIYQYFLANPLKENQFKNSPGVLVFIGKALYILVSLGVSFGLIYGMLSLMGLFEQNASEPETWGYIIFNLILFCAMLGVIYKLANAGGFLDKNPYYRLLLNILLYIPCLLVIIIDKLTKLLGLKQSSTEAFSPPNLFEIKMLILSLGLLGGYFLWFSVLKKYFQSLYFKRGGKQLINQPVQTDILTNVTSYQSLSKSDTFDYQYAMSFWFYIDSFPPSTSASYNKIVPILSYGENPTIKYSSANNTLYITVKQNIDGNSLEDLVKEKDIELNPEIIDKWTNEKDKINNSIEDVKNMRFGNDVDTDGHRIIYDHSDVQLQKWNHILLNYNGGTLDVFYNGRLVKSAIEVVPYMKFDMLSVGSENGISGNIANLMYFDHPLDILTINTLYTSLMDKNPPVIPGNKDIL
jgi:hypothetical protein